MTLSRILECCHSVSAWCVYTKVCLCAFDYAYMRRLGGALGVLSCHSPPYSLGQALSIEAWALIFQLDCQLAIPSNPPVSTLPPGLELTGMSGIT